MRHYLLVDDNAAFAENAAEIIRDRGDAATVATSGAEALRALENGGRFDALVTDLRMPGMDGFALLQAARQADPGLPALVVSAFASPALLERVRRFGVFALLGKPVPLPRLLALLACARRDGLVALVEDDHALADNLTEGLNAHGFSVVTATTVDEAKGLCAHHPVLAVVDLCVPGGPTGAALLQVRAGCPELPLVAITGFAEPEPEGVKRLLRKPFRTKELLEAVEELRLSRGAA